MLIKSATYIRLNDGDTLPDISNFGPFKAIVVIESEVSQLWQWDVSRWLVLSGCRYMMAWGPECSSWDDSVDEANLEAFDYGDIPESDLVMTTCHEDEDLADVFWFAKHSAGHPFHDLRKTVVLHISKDDGQTRLQELYAQA